MFGGKRGSDTSLGEGCGKSLLLSLSEAFQAASLSLFRLRIHSSSKLNLKHLML